MNDDKRMAEISEIQARHIDKLMAYPHVVGVGIGMRQRDGDYVNELVLVVMVDKKIPADQLDSESILPEELEGVEIDVQETGDFST